MKTITCLLLLLCVYGAASFSVSALSEDSGSKNVNRPSRFHELTEEDLPQTDKPLKHKLSRAPTTPNTNVTDSNQPLCWDSRLGSFVASGLQLYPQDMGKMAKYVLDQIIRARYPGYWLVHGQKVAYGTQGPDWQTLTNGKIYDGTNPNACFLRDTYYYILVLKIY